jgi:hypothetical protein
MIVVYRLIVTGQWFFSLFAGLFLTGCAGTLPISKNNLKLVPLVEMAAEIQKSPVIVQQAYQFAAANPDILTEIPCYCGCGDMGHTSNYSCYVSKITSDGVITYDTHALGCSICVDITQDTMRLLRQGKSIQEIRNYIDQNYSKFGPSNMKP